MRHFFTKMTAVMLCGAFLLTGCHKEIKQDIADLKADTAALWAEINELKTNLEATYVTKAELQLVSASLADLQDAVKAVEALVDSKADAAALEAAIAELEAKINGFVTPDELEGFLTLEDLEGYAKEDQLEGLASAEALAALEALIADLKTQAETAIADLKEQVEAIKGCDCESSEPAEGCDCDLEAINSSIEALAQDLAAYKDVVAEYMKKTDEAIEALKKEIEYINSDEFLAELYTYVDAQDKAILDAIAGLLEDLVEVNEALAEAAEKADLALLTAQAALDKAGSAGGSTGGCDCPDYSSSIKALTNRLTELENTIKSLQGSSSTAGLTEEQVKDLIAEALESYEGVNDDIDDIMEDLALLMDKMAEREIVSLVLVPDVIVNGADAVKFSTIAYGDKLASSVATVTYRVNPSTANIDATRFELVAHEAEIITKAGLAIEPASYADGELKFEIQRSDVDGNVFAIAATTSEATVYSAYAQVYEVQASAADLVFANPGEVTVSSLSVEDVAKNVYVEDFDLDVYGFKYAYTVDGSELNEITAEGTYTVEVKVVDADGVTVTSTELIVNVVEGIATATVQVAAQRVAFEVSDVKEWAIALKDKPNTIETIKQAAEAAIEGDFYTAYELLGGVPGFVKQTRTFTGNGTSESMITPMMVSLAFEIPDEYKDLYDQLPDSVKDIIDSIDEETFNDLKDIVKENEDLVGDIIEDFENAEDFSGIVDILENENYQEIIDEVTGALENVDLDQIITGGLADAVIDMLPAELGSLIDKVESYLPEDFDISSFIASLVEQIGVENLGDLLASVGDLDTLLASVQQYAEGIIDTIKGLVDFPVVGDIVSGLIGDFDFEAIKNYIASIDINDIIDADAVAAIKERISSLLSYVQDYIENNTGDDNTGDDNTGDDNTGDDNTGDDNTGDDNTGDDNTGDDNTDVDYTAAQLLAIEAATTDLYNNIAAANENVIANLSNGSWGKLLTILDNEYVAAALEYVPEAGFALELLKAEIEAFVTYQPIGEIEVVEVK